MIYNKVLLDNIEKEKAGIDYIYSVEDKSVLEELFNEIKTCTGVSISYLAEIDAFAINGAGQIMAKYITRISSDSVRCFLIPQIVSDKVPNCSQILLQLYHNFRESNEYIAKNAAPAPCHIYARFDNAFAKLKSKKMKMDLLDVVKNPRDAFYLPFTTKMLASWKMPELKEILIKYSRKDNITAKEVGIDGRGEYTPSYDTIKRELRFIAIDGLRYYPSKEVQALLETYREEEDISIRRLSEKILQKMKKTK